LKEKKELRRTDWQYTISREVIFKGEDLVHAVINKVSAEAEESSLLEAVARERLVKTAVQSLL
jgi:hypothetical protein